MSKDLTHGRFSDNAVFSQSLKNLMRQSKNWSKLTPTQVEALEMIAVNLSRILGGNPNHADHWHRIKDYAELASTEPRLGLDPVEHGIHSLVARIGATNHKTAVNSTEADTNEG